MPPSRPTQGVAARLSTVGAGTGAAMTPVPPSLGAAFAPPLLPRGTLGAPPPSLYGGGDRRHFLLCRPCWGGRPVGGGGSGLPLSATPPPHGRPPCPRRRRPPPQMAAGGSGSGSGRARDSPLPPSLPGGGAYTPEALAFSEIGRITGAHGVRGELKLRAATDWARQRLAPDTPLPRRQGRRDRDGGGGGVPPPPPPPPAAAVKPRHPPPQRYLLLPGRLYPRPVGVTVSRKASQAGVWVVGLDCCTCREEVAGLVGGRLYVRASERPRMGAGEYLIQDLVGMDVLLRPPGGGGRPLRWPPTRRLQRPAAAVAAALPAMLAA